MSTHKISFCGEIKIFIGYPSRAMYRYSELHVVIQVGLNPTVHMFLASLMPLTYQPVHPCSLISLH